MKNTRTARRAHTVRTRKIAVSGLVIALYVGIIYLTQDFSFGTFQIRVVDALYALCYIYPFLTVPLAVASSLGNVIGGMGLPDIIGGFFAGLVTCWCMVMIRRLRWNEWLLAVPTIVVSALMVPVWLAPILHVNYFFLMATIGAGEIVSGILGVLLVKALRRALPPL